MNFLEYQGNADRTINWELDRGDQLLNMALGLAGEAGELAEIVKKYKFQGHDLDVDAIRNEAGDLLWYLSGLCTVMGWSLVGVAQQNIDKLRERYPDGFSSANSQARRDQR